MQRKTDTQWFEFDRIVIMDSVHGRIRIEAQSFRFVHEIDIIDLAVVE